MPSAPLRRPCAAPATHSTGRANRQARGHQPRGGASCARSRRPRAHQGPSSAPNAPSPVSGGPTAWAAIPRQGRADSRPDHLAVQRHPKRPKYEKSEKSAESVGPRPRRLLDSPGIMRVEPPACTTAFKQPPKRGSAPEADGIPIVVVVLGSDWPPPARPSTQAALGFPYAALPASRSHDGGRAPGRLLCGRWGAKKILIFCGTGARLPKLSGGRKRLPGARRRDAGRARLQSSTNVDPDGIDPSYSVGRSSRFGTTST